MNKQSYCLYKQAAEEVGHRLAIPDTPNYRTIPVGELGKELNKANDDRMFRILSDYESIPVAGADDRDQEKFLRYLNRLHRFNYY